MNGLKSPKEEKIMQYFKVNDGYAIKGYVWQGKCNRCLEYGVRLFSLTGDGCPYFTVSLALANIETLATLIPAEEEYIQPQFYYYANDHTNFMFYVIVGIPSLKARLDKLGLKYYFNQAQQTLIIPCDYINISQFSDYFPQLEQTIVDDRYSQPPQRFIDMFFADKELSKVKQNVTVRATYNRPPQGYEKLHYIMSDPLVTQSSIEAKEDTLFTPTHQHKEFVIESSFKADLKCVAEANGGTLFTPRKPHRTSRKYRYDVDMSNQDMMKSSSSFRADAASSAVPEIEEAASNHTKLGLTPLLNEWEEFFQLSLCRDTSEFDKHLELLVVTLTQLISSPGEVENGLHYYLNFGKTVNHLQDLFRVLSVEMNALGCH
jgi:hypothetical protein